MFDLTFDKKVGLRRFLSHFINNPASGTCKHCGAGWNWVKYKIIPKTSGKGFFFLCENCFKGLGIEKILIYAQQFSLRWEEDWENIKTDITRSLMFLKGHLSKPPFESWDWGIFENTMQVVYEGDHVNSQNYVRVENASSSIIEDARVITFTLSWGGLFGLGKQYRTFRSVPIEDLNATKFKVWPLNSDVRSDTILEWIRSDTLMEVGVRADVVES